MRFTSHAAIVALFAMVASPAMAQPAPGAKPPAAAAASPAAPAATAPATAAPPAIDVSDPLLAPLPPAKTVLRDFRDVLSIVSARSTDLRISQLEIERAEGASRQALAGALPQVTASGQFTHHLITTPVTTTKYDGCTNAQLFSGNTSSCERQVTTDVPKTPTAVAQLTASQAVLAPRAWYAIGTAERSVEAARRSYEDRRRTVLGTAANAIVAVVTTERVAEIARVGLKSSLERLELMQRKVRVGSGTSLDIVRARQDVALARSTLLSANESLLKAREALGLALGSSDAYGVTPDISLDAISASAAELCAAASPEERADVVASKQQLEIAQRGVTDVKLAYAPTAELSTTLSYASEPIVEDRHHAWSIQGVLTIPIWDGGARYGQMRSAKAQVSEQQETVAATLRGATIEATQAMRGITVAEQARDVSKTTADLARESARLSQVAFDAGASTSFELVESARQQREAELDLAVKEFELVSAKITALLAASNCRY